jgi:hypothetical protein
MTTSEDTAVQELRYEADLELSGLRGSLLTAADTAGLACWNEDWLVREQLVVQELDEIYFMFACFLLLAIGDDNF